MRTGEQQIVAESKGQEGRRRDFGVEERRGRKGEEREGRSGPRGKKGKERRMHTREDGRGGQGKGREVR